MNIPISGVNYRKPETEDTGQKPEVRGKSETRSRAEVRIRSRNTGQRAKQRAKRLDQETAQILPLNQKQPSDQPLNNPENRGSCSSKIQKNQNTMKNKPQHNHFISDALKVVHEGLKSMQAIQMQTAEAHQKFLETQTQAAQTLQNMMENTQRLAEASMGIKTEDQDFGFQR